MLRWCVRLVLALLVGTALLIVAVVYLALEEEPLVASQVVFTPGNIERAKRLLDRNDPRKMREGVLRTIVIGQQDLDLAINYAASRYAHGSTQIVLKDAAASVHATFTLPVNPVGRYANVQASLQETGGLPRVDRLRVGRIVVPGFLGNWLIAQAIARLQTRHDHLATAADVVKKVQIREGVLQVVFAWNDRFASELKRAIVPVADQERWKVYQARLVQLLEQSPGGRSIAFEQLLLPLLQLARERSGNAGAALENRAVIIVLAFYVNGKGLSALVPAARDWQEPAPRVVTLAGRTDFPQHFTISAALAATAGTPLSDAVGLYKEVDDSRGGSGFSFNDIAADRAGTRFGDLAGVRDADAAKLFGRIGGGLPQSAFFPEVKDLPEFMAEADFKRRYGGIGKPAYQKMAAEIERRIAALPLYR